MPMASPLPAPGSPSSAALQPPPPKGTGQGSEEAAGGLGGAEQPGLACEDEQEACLEWAAGDGCLTLGPSFMLESCRRSCGVCGAPTNASVPQTVRSPKFACHMCRLMACSTSLDACAGLSGAMSSTIHTFPERMQPLCFGLIAVQDMYLHFPRSQENEGSMVMTSAPQQGSSLYGSGPLKTCAKMLPRLFKASAMWVRRWC